MKRLLVLMMVVGLIVGSVATADAAKRKKKKAKKLTPVELTYFLHWDDDGAGGCSGAQYMDLEDKEGDTGCSYTFQGAQELFIASGQDPLIYVWPATDGLPFILDASKKIGLELAMRATFAVQARVEVTIEGTVNGEVKEIATGESPVFNTAATGQTGPSILTFELDIDKSLDKKKVESLVMNSTIRGYCMCYEGRENPGSFIVVPALK